MILTQRAGQTAFKDLLESDTIEIEKLKQYVQKNSIVAEFKPLCWKILLGIKSPYRATRRYVDQANCDIYKRIHSTLTNCRIIQDTTPISQQFLSMYLLDSHAVKLPIASTVNLIQRNFRLICLSFNRKSMKHFYPLQILFVHFLILITNNA
jgi:hypothetical protein